MADVWTPERDELLKQYAAERRSYGEIARLIMTLLPGTLLSRGAIAGRINRLRLRKEIWPAAQEAPDLPAKPKAPPKPRGRPRKVAAPVERPKPALVIIDEASTPPPPEIVAALLDDPAPAGPVFVSPPVALSDTVRAVVELKGCKWGIGDPRQPGFTFCNRTKIPGLSWCREHAVEVFQSEGAKKRTQPMTTINLF